MNRRPHILAWTLVLLGLLLFCVTIVLNVIIGPATMEETNWGSPGWRGVFFVALPSITFLVVGGMIALRRTENRVGWLCLLIALIWLMIGMMDVITRWSVMRGLLAVAAWLRIFGPLWVFAGGLTGTHLLLRLPDGLLPSLHWRWYSAFCTIVLILAFVLVVTQPGRLVSNLPETENPLASDNIQLLSPLLLLLPLSLIGGITSLVVRYRQAGGVERLQLRWIAFGGIVFFLIFLIVMIFVIVGIPAQSPIGQLLGDLALTGYAVLPISIGIAILRYRLYDIDILINRTLVYVPLTLILAAVFSLAQQVLSSLMTSYWGQETVVSTIVTTLLIVAIFEPLKKNIEEVVAKFSKRIPDPTHTVKAFREKVQSRVLRVNAETITEQLLEEVVLGFGATSGAVYLDEHNSAQPIHATRNWNGTAQLTIPLQGAKERTPLGELALGSARMGGDYNDRQRLLLQEMARITATAIEQDRY